MASFWNVVDTREAIQFAQYTGEGSAALLAPFVRLRIPDGRLLAVPRVGEIVQRDTIGPPRTFIRIGFAADPPGQDRSFDYDSQEGVVGDDVYLARLPERGCGSRAVVGTHELSRRHPRRRLADDPGQMVLLCSTPRDRSRITVPQ